VTRSSVKASQRFNTETNPCPACGGGQDVQGEERCYGYLLESRKGYFCSNVESTTFNEEADAWLHFFDEGAEPEEEDAPDDETGQITLKELARAKKLPAKAFRDLGCRDHGRGVLIGKKLRLLNPKYKWTEGLSAKDYPLFPMPGGTIEDTFYITAGETDAITLRHVGRPAYGITSGEKKGKAVLTPGHYRDLMKRGAEHVTIAGDGDDHGQAWLKQEAASAQAAGLRVSIVDLSPRYDRFGAGVKDLNELWQTLSGDADAFLAAADEHTRDLTQARICTLEDLRTMATEEVPYLVTDFLSPGEKMGITGPPKNYKSWLALKLAHAVATGSRFLERAEWEVPEARPVLFVEEEGDPAKFARRIERAFQGIENADFFLIPRMGFSLLERAQVDWMIERVNERDAGLLVLDPWQRMIVGADEDKAKETGPAWDEVHRITLECPRCAVLILHHANKAGGLTLNAIRGSSRFAGEVDLSMIVKVEEPGLIHSSLIGRDVPNHMAENGILEVRFDVHDPFEMSAQGFTVNVSGPGRPSKVQKLLDVLRSHQGRALTQTEVAKEAGVSVSTVSTHFRNLIEEGEVEVFEGKYRLTQGENS
jgi:hypothetical protein